MDTLCGGIDLHSSNNVVVVTNDADEVVACPHFMVQAE